MDDVKTLLDGSTTDSLPADVIATRAASCERSH
jgi:hypothetical protein